MTPLEQKCARLKAENEALQDRVTYLMDALGSTLAMRFPSAWALTGSERVVLAVLVKRDVASRDAIMAALYSDQFGDEPDVAICNVFVCKLRKKLRPLGIEIKSVWGLGWRIEPEAKARIRELMGEAADTTADTPETEFKGPLPHKGEAYLGGLRKEDSKA